MNFTKVSSRVTSHYITDPYTTLMHYRRAFKLLQGLREKSMSVLCLGNKNQVGIDWKNLFEGLEITRGQCDQKVIDAAPRFHSLIVCADPVLYAPYLRKVSLPVLSIVSAKELHDYPEILQVTDYLLPAPGNRKEAALRQLMFNELSKNPVKDDDTL